MASGVILHYVRESLIPAPVEAVFAFHERADALALLIPPWDPTRILQPPASLEAGTRVILETRIGPLTRRIVAEHTAYKRNEYFEDLMREGPFPYWRHRHLFLPNGSGTLLRDAVEYTPPLGMLGRIADPFFIRPRLERMFAHRHAVTRREVLAAVQRGADEETMRSSSAVQAL
jgi:hypothetical protein